MSTPPEYEPALLEGDTANDQAKAGPKKKAAKKRASAKKKSAAKKKVASKQKPASKKAPSKKRSANRARSESSQEKPPAETVSLSEENTGVTDSAKTASDSPSDSRPRSRSRSEEGGRGGSPKKPKEDTGKDEGKERERDPSSRETESRGRGHRESDASDRQEDQRSSRRSRRQRGRQRDRSSREEGSDDEDFQRSSRKEVELGPASEGGGFVELSPKGFGFLRQADRHFYQTNRDTFIPPDMARDYGLRDGMVIHGEIRRGARGLQLTAIHTINGKKPSAYQNLPIFEELTAINPNKRWILETDPKRHTTRIIDMITPVGRGQRGLIVAPPRTGKTTLLEHIAEALDKNYPDTKVIMLLIDERPEEVTELKRALPNAEIMASSNDNDTRTHMRMAQLTIERAKRLVEAGENVFILLDSITRLARAFNRANKGKGGLNKGGLSNQALEIPRRLFAAARNTREAGSLTILATALIDTGTMMDEAIFQEFKGTGNMELVLDRNIAQNYVFPAVNIFKSGTRREELLLPPHQIEKIYVIRRGLSGHKPIEAMERLLSFVERFPNNAQMLLEIKASSAE